VNSASVAGGDAPAPRHSTPPEPQSPVAQEPLPPESKRQPERAQKRPDHPCGAYSERDCPGASSNPVVSSGGVPEPERTPGHTVSAHRLVKVKVMPPTDDAAAPDGAQIQSKSAVSQSSTRKARSFWGPPDPGRSKGRRWIK
jgi:hypothetical protein